MRKRVTVVEHSPPALFSLVGRNNSGFNLYTSCDSCRQFDGEQVIASQEMIFGDLAEPTSCFAIWQSFERIYIAKHCARLPERTDQVFPLCNIHTGFTTNRRVNHADQSCWYLNDCRATMPTCSSKASDIGDHSTTQTNYDI